MNRNLKAELFSELWFQINLWFCLDSATLLAPDHHGHAVPPLPRNTAPGPHPVQHLTDQQHEREDCWLWAGDPAEDAAREALHHVWDSQLHLPGDRHPQPAWAGVGRVVSGLHVLHPAHREAALRHGHGEEHAQQSGAGRLWDAGLPVQGGAGPHPQAAAQKPSWSPQPLLRLGSSFYVQGWLCTEQRCGNLRGFHGQRECHHLYDLHGLIQHQHQRLLEGKEEAVGWPAAPK